MVLFKKEDVKFVSSCRLSEDGKQIICDGSKLILPSGEVLVSERPMVFTKTEKGWVITDDGGADQRLIEAQLKHLERSSKV